MALNIVQQNFVQEARQHLETFIRAVDDFDVFVEAYDAQAAGGDALPQTAGVLDDDGDTPRIDAPNMTGADVKALRDLSETMSGALAAGPKQTMIGKMVRTLSVVLRG